MNEALTTLAREAEGRFEEKKSVFIAHACPVSGEAEAQAYIRSIRAAFSDAQSTSKPPLFSSKSSLVISALNSKAISLPLSLLSSV